MNYLYIFCKLICDKSKEEDSSNVTNVTKKKSNNTPDLGLSKTGSFQETNEII